MKYYNASTQITIDGEIHTISEWSNMYELYPSTIRSRYNTGLMKILSISFGAVNGFTRAER